MCLRKHRHFRHYKANTCTLYTFFSFDQNTDTKLGSVDRNLDMTEQKSVTVDRNMDTSSACVIRETVGYETKKTV